MGQGNSSAVVQGLCYLAFPFILLYFDWTRKFGVVMLVIYGIVIVGLVIAAAVQNDREKQRADAAKKRHDVLMKAAEKKIEAVVSKHMATLANRRDTLVRVDRYGVVEAKEWNQEVQHFIDRVVRPTLDAEEAQAVADAGVSSIFQRLVEERVAAFCTTRKAPVAVPEDVSPSDFEGLCAALLRQHGWEASTTKASGDQGADVVARKGDVTIVLQCKLYAGKIGNKAVQEVLAAKRFYNADVAAVVCKSDFTKSAKELAQVAEVHILHFSELEGFAQDWSIGEASGAVAQQEGPRL